MSMIINPYGFGPSVPTDPYFSSVVALLHMDGTDTSTTITDQTSRAWTANGNAQLDTAIKKFGTAALLLDGSGDYLTTPWDMVLVPFNPGAGDYTGECWIYPAVNNSVRQIMDAKSSGARYWVFLTNASGKLQFTGWDSTGTQTVSVVGSTTIATNTWQHVAWVKSGGNYYVFLDGVLDGSGSGSSGIGSNSGQPTSFYIGRDPSNAPARDFSGSIDEVRLTKGVARYTSTFSPPTAAFPDS